MRGGPAVHDVQDDPRICLHICWRRYRRRVGSRAQWRSPFVRTRELIGDTPPASRRSVSPSASRSTRFRRSSGRSLPLTLRNSAAIPPTRVSTNSAVAVAGWARPPLRAGAGRIQRAKCWCSTAPGGLFLAASPPRNWVTPRPGRPAMLIPNPFYAAYAAGAIGAIAAVYLDHAETGFLPDLDSLDEELLARTVAFYIARHRTRRARSPIAHTLRSSRAGAGSAF